MLASVPLQDKERQNASAYDILYQAFGHKRETKRGKIQISNPIPQHDILHENYRAKTKVIRRIPSRSEPDLKIERNPARPSVRPTASSRKGSNESMTLAAPFSARFGFAAVPHRSAASYAVRRPPRSRPSLSSLPSVSIKDEIEEQIEYGSGTRRTVDPVHSFENMHKLTEIELFFLGKVALIHTEFFELSKLTHEMATKPLATGNRTFIRDDVVYKVVSDADEYSREPRKVTIKSSYLSAMAMNEHKIDGVCAKLFLLSDMLIYGTPISSIPTDRLAAAYDRQTIMILDDLEVLPVKEQGIIAHGTDISTLERS